LPYKCGKEYEGAWVMRDYILRRVMKISRYIVDTKATVRQTAKVFDVSKSTVHKDVTERLPRIEKRLAEEVKKVLEYNKSERHIRGGEATRRKYQPADVS
jgi:putative DeoR family transcriptional regulator (stage III sporulation protein D)